CRHCNALLLSTESDSFCCGNGVRALPPLHPFSPCMRALLDNNHHRRHLIEFCHVINNLFSFVGIGVTSSFKHFSTGIEAGPPAVAITSRTYH
ncbi:hypothetical protein BU15DRAFT_9553, partial [Melanogaster broomeanus]